MDLNHWGPLFDEALLLVIAVFLTVKGVILRRRTGVGRALARNNFAFAAAYFGAFLGTVVGLDFFLSDGWRWGIRSVIVLTLGHAIWEMTMYYGGWRGLAREFRLTFEEFRSTWRERGGMLCWQAGRARRAIRAFLRLE